MKVQQQFIKAAPTHSHQVPAPIKQGQGNTLLVPRKVIENYSYNMNEIIGKGYSSNVFKGKDDRDNDSVAVKVIDMKMIKNEVQKFLLQNEIQIIKKLKNYNLLETKDVFQTQNNTYIITELCNHGDLKELLAKYGKLSESAALKILRHILNGMRELVNQNIIHRDLKPANILLKDGVPKIADFGFSQDIHAPPCKVYYNVGTPMYMCPQALKKNQYSYKSDIWSLGVLYYELLYGATPWNATTEQELAHKITHTPVQFPKNPVVSDLSKDFIRRCLDVDENKRLGPQDLEKHPLIQQSVQRELQNKAKQQQQKKQEQQQQQIQQQQPTNQQIQQKPEPKIEKKVQNTTTTTSNQQQQQQQVQLPQSPRKYSAVQNHPVQLSNNTYLEKSTGKVHQTQQQQQGQQQIVNRQQSLPYAQQQQQEVGNKGKENNYQNITINNNNSKQSSSNNLSQQSGTPTYQNTNYTQNNPSNTNVYPQQGEVLRPQSNNYENLTRPQQYVQQNNSQAFKKSNYQQQETYSESYLANNNGKSYTTEISKSPFTDKPQESHTATGTTSQLSCNSNNSGNNGYVNEEYMQNDMIILAQINFCRFLVRLQKLTEEFSNLETPYLKERVVYFILKNVMIKITKLKDMCDQKQNLFYLTNFQNYINNESFKKFIIVINEYYVKYMGLFNNYNDKISQQKPGMKEEMMADKKFETIFNRNFYDSEQFYFTLQTFLRYSIHEMNHVIKCQLKDESENVPSIVEGSIVLLDYLVTYFQLAQLILDRFVDYSFFAQASKIEQIAEGRPVKLTKSHFAQIRNKIYSLEI